jgi:hypothetical protein
MGFINKSDVKNHLSTRSKTVFPFRPTSQSDITGNSRNEPRGKNLNVPDSRQDSDLESPKARPITPIDVLNSSDGRVARSATKKPQA